MGALFYGTGNYTVDADSGREHGQPGKQPQQAWDGIMPAVAAALGAAYVLGRVLRAGVLNVRHLSVALVLWLAFAVLYLDFLRGSGILWSELPAVLAAPLLISAVSPLAAVALAPWSLSLIRHV